MQLSPTMTEAHVGPETEYNGMVIPKGATLLLSMGDIHHDGQVYDDVLAFNPNRFLGHPRLAHEYAANPDPSRRDHYIYGAGRRICPGIHLAERSLWRITAKLLWAFDFAEPRNPITGAIEHIDSRAYTSGAATSPLPFKVDIRVRSDTHRATIEREYAEAQEFMKQFEDTRVAVAVGKK